MGDFEQMLNNLCKMSKAQLVQMVRNTDEVETALNIFKNVMKEDYARVLRCKDCKWFADNNGGEWYGCKMFHVVRITPEDAPKPDDFCSYGERKNGGDSDAKSM